MTSGTTRTASGAKKQVTFKLEKETLELLAFTAKASGCTQASIVDDALREYLGDASESETLDASLALIAHEAEKSRRRLAAMAQYAEDQKREKEQERQRRLRDGVQMTTASAATSRSRGEA